MCKVNLAPLARPFSRDPSSIRSGRLGRYFLTTTTSFGFLSPVGEANLSASDKELENAVRAVRRSHGCVERGA